MFLRPGGPGPARVRRTAEHLTRRPQEPQRPRRWLNCGWISKGASQLPLLATGRAAVTNRHSHGMLCGYCLRGLLIMKVTSAQISALLRWRVVASDARGTVHDFLFVISLPARTNNIQSFRCKASPRKGRTDRYQQNILCEVRWLRRPGPWLGVAEAVMRCM